MDVYSQHKVRWTNKRYLVVRLGHTNLMATKIQNLQHQHKADAEHARAAASQDVKKIQIQLQII